MKSIQMVSVLSVFLLVAVVFVFGDCVKENAKNSTAQAEQHEIPAAPSEVRSVVGTWRTEDVQQRGIWVFGEDGKCVIRPVGLREQKGSYSYNGKELVLTMEHGTSRYTVTDNIEPQLKLAFRWSDTHTINVTLIRAQ